MQVRLRDHVTLLCYSWAALLPILGAVYPMRSTVQMARLIREHYGGWDHGFRSDLDQFEQYAEWGCELVVTDPVRDLPELWRWLEVDRDAGAAANTGSQWMRSCRIVPLKARWQ